MDRNPNETVRKTAEEALSRLAAELEAGRSEALTNYLAAMSRFRRYSWSNVLLIEAQRPDATHVAGIHTWNDVGRTVKRGEKGIIIFAPVVVKQHEPLRGQAPPKDAFPLAGFRAAYVFDVSQTEGKPLPEFAQTTVDPKEYGEQLKSTGCRARHRAEVRPEHRTSSRHFCRRGDSPDAGSSLGPGVLGSDPRADARDASPPPR